MFKISWFLIDYLQIYSFFNFCQQVWYNIAYRLKPLLHSQEYNNEHVGVEYLLYINGLHIHTKQE